MRSWKLITLFQYQAAARTQSVICKLFALIVTGVKVTKLAIAPNKNIKPAQWQCLYLVTSVTSHEIIKTFDVQFAVALARLTGVK